jgi:hypothetical protein
MTAGASSRAAAARRDAVARDLAAQLRRLAADLKVHDPQDFAIADLVLVASQCYRSLAP